MRPRPLTAVRQRPGIFALIVFLVLQTLPITVMAQQGTEVFVLPVASVSTLYQVNIQKVLRDTYRRKLQSTAQAPNFRWSLESGALPTGLRVTPDGNVIGRPRAARAEPYQFNVRVLDSFGSSDELVLTFELRVEAAKIRLVSTDAPKLVPVSEESSGNENGSARINLTDRIAPLWNANHSGVKTSVDVATENVVNDSNRSQTVSSTPERVAPRRSSAAASADFIRTGSVSSPSTTTAAAPAAQDGADPSCPACRPTPPIDETKDFVIDVRTGETRGKKKFRLKDNARIVVIEKNPFLFEYKVTFKEKVIVESAISEYFAGWPLLADNLDKSKAETSTKSPDKARGEPCGALRDQYPARVGDLDRSRARMSEAVDWFAENYTPLADEYERIADELEGERKKLYDPNKSCTEVCQTATNIKSKLQGYDPDLDTLSKNLTRFKLMAEVFKDDVERLIEVVQDNPRPDPDRPAITGDECRTVLNNLRAEAAGYLTIVSDLETGIEKVKTGTKTFSALVKTINKVFSNPNAFHQVYNRGDYGSPTDLEITVETKDLTKADASFVKLIDAVTINFGGGPRFAVAGGVVVSPFETINFKRVPALVDGEPATIIGRDESSNSRILPILMLHGRFAEGRGPISGFHFSLGVTAKPTEDSTNVEFLIGPSISFIDQRLFFTFGGYAGRRKQLEGNFVPGQVLPEGFTDDIPTSNHLVWKPGFALTYKFK